MKIYFQIFIFLIVNNIWSQNQIGCVGFSHNYIVDESENNGLGTTGSIYEWQVISSQFQGSILPISSSGNSVTVNWDATPEGSYILQVTEINNGCTNSVNLNVTLKKLDDYNLPNLFLCIHPETNISIPQTINTNLSTNQYSHVWEFQNNIIGQSNQITINQSGIYTLYLTDLTSNCAKEISFTATNLPQMNSQYVLESDFQFNQFLVITTTGGVAPYQYSLNGGFFQENSSFTFDSPGSYSIEIMDSVGCFSKELIIDVFMYPPFFTPNDDGFNDFWTIQTPVDLKKANISIFDRYGKLIYNFNSNRQGWDGKLNGYQLPSTDYWFVIDYVNRNGETKKFKSHFSLKR